jgi:serine/threonine protein kinase
MSSKLFKDCFGKKEEEVEIIQKLGEGSKGKVYLIKKEGKFYIRKKSICEESKVNIKIEYETLSLLKNIDNLPRISKYNEREGYIDFEYLPDYKCLDKVYKYLSYSDCIDIILQVSRIIKNVHEKGIVHRDIKIENILYNFNEKKVHIIDWDCSYNDRISDNIPQYGTIIFNPPEMFEEIYVDHKKIDIWQIGTMLYDLLSKGVIDVFEGNLKVSACRDGKLMNNIMSCNWNRKDLKYKNLEGFFDSIFKPEENRISLDELIKYIENLKNIV